MQQWGWLKASQLEQQLVLQQWGWLMAALLGC